MKKDINPSKVENVAVAIVKEKNEEGIDIWNAYLLNLNDYPIDMVLISSQGYGQNKKTSQLRHFMEDIPAKGFKKIEPLMEDVFVLTNEFWVSYNRNNEMLDKKYIFVPGSIAENLLTNVPLINKPGIIHL